MCRRCENARSRDWVRRNPKRNAATQAEWRRQHPAQAKCYATYAYAVKSGKVTRPAACAECGVTTGVEAHHPDYSQPLAVVGMCKDCHEAHHAALLTGTAEAYDVAAFTPLWTPKGRRWLAKHAAHGKRPTKED